MIMYSQSIKYKVKIVRKQICFHIWLNKNIHKINHYDTIGCTDNIAYVSLVLFFRNIYNDVNYNDCLFFTN